MNSSQIFIQILILKIIVNSIIRGRMYDPPLTQRRRAIKARSSYLAGTQRHASLLLLLLLLLNEESSISREFVPRTRKTELASQRLRDLRPPREARSHGTPRSLIHGPWWGYAVPPGDATRGRWFLPSSSVRVYLCVCARTRVYTCSRDGGRCDMGVS